MNKIARAVPDDETVITLNFELEKLINISEAKLLSAYKIGENIPRFKWNSKDPDEANRLYTLRSDVFNGENLLTNFEFLGQYTNPSAGKFRDRIFVAVPLQIVPSGVNLKPMDGSIQFRWFNSTRYSYATNDTYLGVYNEIEPLDQPVYGQDPRMIIHNDTHIQLFFTSMSLGMKHQKMGVAELQYLEAEKRMSVTYVYQPILLEHQKTSVQKNWSPFVHNGEVLLVQSINPLTVVRLQGYGTTAVIAQLVSKDNFTHVNCLIGELRGGTNAIRLHDRYLAFYHQRTKLPWDFMTSYLFGAYSFTLDPPFRLLSISPAPIMPKRLYSGPWQGRYIDYCVYPMHLSLEDAISSPSSTSGRLRLSFGSQDKHGYVCEIDLITLLSTMIPVRSIDDDLNIKDDME